MRLAAALHVQGLLASAAFLSLAPRATAQGISYEDMGCADSHSGPDCPRRYRLTGGDGWAGQRTEWEMVSSWETRMYCSPSCGPGGTATRECAFTIAMHGIRSNPSDQVWLMLGNQAGAFDEDEADGGPFCIVFPKSKGEGWEGSCSGDDGE